MPFVRTDTIKPGLNKILIKNISETDLKLFIQLTKINDNTFKYVPETEEIFPNLLLTSKTIQACISRPFFNCEGALDTTGCVTLDGIWDVEVDGVVVGTNLSAANILHTLNALDTFEVTDCSDFSYRLDETNSGKTISLKSTGWDIIAYRENVNDIYNKVSKAKIILKEELITLSQTTVTFPINSQSIEISIPFTNKLSPSITLSATIIGIPNE